MNTIAPRLSSRQLGLYAAGGYLLVSGLLGAGLLVVHALPGGRGPTPVVSVVTTPPTTTYETTTTYSVSPPSFPSETNTSSSEPSGSASASPLDYTQVSGPGGINTVAPAGWPPHPQQGNASSMEADDPASTDFVRYGGSTAGNGDLFTELATAEAQFSQTHSGYNRINLAQTSYHNVPAVDWEFTWDKNGEQRHVHAQYWRIQNVEYVIYVSGAVADLPRLQEIFAKMLANTTP